MARRGRGAFIGSFPEVGTPMARSARPSTWAAKAAKLAQLVSPCDVQW